MQQLFGFALPAGNHYHDNANVSVAFDINSIINEATQRINERKICTLFKSTYYK